MLLLIKVMWVVLCDSVLSFNVLVFVNRFRMCVFGMGFLCVLFISRLNIDFCIWLVVGCRCVCVFFVFILVSFRLCRLLLMIFIVGFLGWWCWLWFWVGVMCWFWLGVCWLYRCGCCLVCLLWLVVLCGNIRLSWVVLLFGYIWCLVWWFVVWCWIDLIRIMVLVYRVWLYLVCLWWWFLLCWWYCWYFLVVFVYWGWESWCNCLLFRLLDCCCGFVYWWWCCCWFVVLLFWLMWCGVICWCCRLLDW